jgi:hypothetical protein
MPIYSRKTQGRLPVICAATATVACTIATLGHVADAATFTVTAYEWHNTIYRNGVPVTPSCVKMTGPIRRGDGARFRAFMDGLRPHRDISCINLDSPGGDVATAVTIADIVNNRDMATSIRGGDMCASACALVFFAGAPRRMGKGARLCVHRAATTGGSETPGTIDATAFTAERLRQYCAGPGAIVRLLATPPGGIAWLNAEDVGMGWLKCSLEKAARKLPPS